MNTFKLILTLLAGLNFSQNPAQSNSEKSTLKIKSVQVLQNKDFTGRGNTDESIFHAIITTEGEGEVGISEVKLNFKGTTSLKDIKSFKIYNTGTFNQFDSRQPSGTIMAMAQPKKKEITLDLHGKLHPGQNHLWLVVDVDEKAKEGNVIDAALVSIKTENQDYKLTHGNPDGEREIILKRVLVLAPGDYGSKNFRIPAIITAADKSLVILTDKRKYNEVDLPEDIDIIAQRSTDNGKTWSEPVLVAKGNGRNKGFGDANLIKTKSGKLVALFVGGVGLWNSTSENPQGHFMSVSTDHGKAWSEPREITDQLYGINCADPVRKTWQSSFFGSGRGLTLRDGRIMAVIAVRETLKNHQLNNYVVYSDDEGDTWKVSEKAMEGGDEAKGP